MTRKKFMDAILEAICTYGALANRSELDGAKNFVGVKAGLFYGIDEDGKGETDHYVLIELKDGTYWRVLPERALKLEEHEQKMWDEFKTLTSEDFDEDEIGDEDITEDD